MDRKDSNKPTLKVKHRSYQPSKAELEADISIPITPKNLARALMRDVKVEETEDVEGS